MPRRPTAHRGILRSLKSVERELTKEMRKGVEKILRDPSIHPVQPAYLTTMELAVVVKLMETTVTPGDAARYRAFMGALKKLSNALYQKEGRRVADV